MMGEVVRRHSKAGGRQRPATRARPALGAHPGGVRRLKRDLVVVLALYPYPGRLDLGDDRAERLAGEPGVLLRVEDAEGDALPGRPVHAAVEVLKAGELLDGGV